jgi:hypothetical protein
MHLTTIDEIKDYSSAFTIDNNNLFENGEIFNIIEKHLIGDYRVNYLKLKNGGKVSKSEKEKLVKKIQEILKDHKDG